MKKYVSLILIICLCLPIMTATGCSQGRSSASEDGRLRVVCAGFVAYDFCRQVLGGDENITMLGKAGMDMHSFEPTAADILMLSEADVFVYVGGEANKWVDGMISAAENKELHLVDMTKCVKGIHSDDHHGHDHGEDEHVWLSFDNAGEIVLSICEAVKKAAISNGVDEKVVDTYDKNARQYIDALTTLKGKYLDMVASAKRKMIVVADRFPFVYLVEELGLEYCAAFPGCSTETNASFAVQMELIEKTKENGIPVVFMIDGSNGAVAKKVCEQTGAKLATLDSAQIVSDARLAEGESYIDIMEKNYNALLEALN
jgi:zinc transport system substrate-binding protein